MSLMVECPYSIQESHRHFPIEDVLIDVGKYIKCMKAALVKQNASLEDKERRIVELQNRNEHLNKAVNTLKGHFDLPLGSQLTECLCKRRRKKSVDTANTQDIISDDDELQRSTAFMNTALNGTALKTASCLDMVQSGDVITATEKQSNENKPYVRQRCLQKNQTKPESNEKIKKEKQNKLSLKQISTVRPLLTESKNRSNWHSKDENSFHLAKESLKSEKTSVKIPKQSYFIRDGNQMTNTLVLSKTSQQKKHFGKDDDECIENVFDFSATETFLYETDSAPEITKSFNADEDIFSPKGECQTNLDPSVVILPNPTPAPIVVDDTGIILHSEVELKKPETSREDEDSLDDFEMSADEILLKSTPKIFLKTRTINKEQDDEESSSFLKPNFSNLNIKRESSTSAGARPAINPIFQHTQCSEEMDDESEAELTDIDLNKLSCGECIKFLRFIGSNMSLKRKQEYLSKCQEHHRQTHCTPEGFWNPHINSFSANDPRNEVIIDKRWQQKKQK